MHGKFGAVVPWMARVHAGLVVAQARLQLAFPQEFVRQQRLATLGHVALCNPVLEEVGKGFSKSALWVTSDVSRILTTPIRPSWCLWLADMHQKDQLYQTVSVGSIVT